MSNTLTTQELSNGSVLSQTVPQYISDRSRELREKTQAIQQEHLSPFVSFLSKNGVSTWGELEKHHILRFKTTQREEAELAETTLAARLVVVRTFLKWTRAYYDVSEDIIDATETAIPDLDPEEWARDGHINTEQAQSTLSWFEDSPAYGTRPHVVFALIWHVGMRRGTLRALDVDDVHLEDRRISIRNRPPSTPLKNGKYGQRDVNISDNIARVLEEYLDDHRDEGTVEEEIKDVGMVSRDPLLTSAFGRVDGTTLYRDVTSVTCCGECGRTRRESHKCSEAVGPHDLRRSSLTHHVRSDIDRSLISDRANVGEETLALHYDQSTYEEQAELRRDPIMKKLD